MDEKGEQGCKGTIRPKDRKFRIQVEFINCVGYRRKTNEDNCCMNEFFIAEEQMSNNLCVSDERSAKSQLFGVFDGVGSDASGERASFTAAQFFAQHISDFAASFKTESKLDELFAKANQAVCDQIPNSSTTAVVLCIAQGAARISNAGDSKGYLFRQNELKQLSGEHTKAQQLLSRGLLKADSLEFASKSHEITRFLGEEQIYEYWRPFHTSMYPLEHNDLFLLCSDGLTDMVTDDEIADLLRKYDNNHDAVQALVDKAMEYGGNDNISVMLLRVLLN